MTIDCILEEFNYTSSEIIDTNNLDAVQSIIEYWNINKKIVPVTSIFPLIDNKEFSHFIFRENGKVISQDEPFLSQKICSLIKYTGDLDRNYKSNGRYNFKNADNFALKMGPILDQLTEEGFTSVRKKASELNKRNIKSFRSKNWTHHNVYLTQKRWQKIKTEEESLHLQKHQTLNSEIS